MDSPKFKELEEQLHNVIELYKNEVRTTLSLNEKLNERVEQYIHVVWELEQAHARIKQMERETALPEKVIS